MKCIAIVPAYNEENSIAKVVKQIQKENIDVVVINDGSKDNTSSVAKEAGATVIDLVNNLGIGGGVQTGYMYAFKNGYDYACQIDGDGQHNPKYLKEMIKALEKDKNLDIIIGSRFIDKTSYKQTFMRMLGGKIISFVIKLYTGKKIYDPTSGYRMCNQKIIEQFSKEYPVDFPEPETNLELLLKGYNIKEIKMEMNQRKTGKSFVTPFSSIWYMTKVLLSLTMDKLTFLKKGSK